ncbi:MAG: hypothetical protein ACTSRZ_02855 [Promethearchaeota archaeon]
MSENSNKQKIKYGGIIFFFILYCVYAIFLVINLLELPRQGISEFIPGPLFLELIQIFIVPLFSSIVATFIGLLLVPLFLFFAKVLKGKNYDVAYQDIEQYITSKKLIGRAFYATLFATAVSLTFNNTLYSYGVKFIENASIAYATAAMTVFITPISMLILAPTWFLEDLNLIIYKKKNVEDPRAQTYDISSIGIFWGYILKGFAGITTPIMYFYLFYTNVHSLDLFTILLLIVPIITIGVYSLSSILYVKIFNKRAPKFKNKHNYPIIEVSANLI